MQKARYIMIGGFLGAGKTTAINRLAALLDGRGGKVGLITNDQGTGLTDSALGRANRFPVEEISGGCFCCRFHSLIDAAHQLRDRERPGFFIAEPVGSCTDLAATVSLPLQQLYGEEFEIAPLSVVIDPLRALQALEVEEGKRFSANVVYIYRKQLEEAEGIVINKSDLITAERLAALEEALAQQYPAARRFVISAREGTGLDPWFEWMLTSRLEVRRIMDVDYDRYGEGEALLGWLNLSATLEGTEEWDGNALLPALALNIRAQAAALGAEIAHLKMTLNPAGDPLDLAAVNLVGTTRQPELSHRLADPLEIGELLLNLRAEAPPEVLDAAVQQALQEVCSGGFSLTVGISHAQHFRPGQPNPTHRILKPL
ncbi:MAG: cobalamin biosynthesis protein P47K [Verrucomicrobiales bacterium]|nr:cobalamin biosynthesis protein P47K [Verrucomicrobiales bacterium]